MVVVEEYNSVEHITEFGKQIMRVALYCRASNIVSELYAIGARKGWEFTDKNVEKQWAKARTMWNPPGSGSPRGDTGKSLDSRPDREVTQEPL
jgi:hypothetical protein